MGTFLTVVYGDVLDEIEQNCYRWIVPYSCRLDWEGS